MKHERGLAYGAFAVICIVWGTTYLAIRIAIETIPPLLLTGARYTVAGLIMLTIARLRGQRLPRDRRTLVNLALIGFLMVGVGNLAVVIAEQWVPSGMAALLVATAPFWMVLMERMRGSGEHLAPRGQLGMVVGFVGVALLVMPSGPGGKVDGKFILGALIIQLGSIGWQYGTIRGKYMISNVPFVMSAALQMLFGGVAIDVLGLAIGEASRFTLNVRTFSALVYLSIFGSVLAYSAYMFAITRMSTTKMSLYAYVNPLVAVILGWLILNEPLTWLSITAMTVILAGVALVQTAGLRKAEAVVEPPELVEKNAA